MAKTVVTVNRVAEGARFVGDLHFAGRLEVDGTVSGRIIADPMDGSEVVVGQKGRVDGAIDAAAVVVGGQVDGPIQASGRLEVLAGARVRGELSYRDLQIQHRALVEGSLRSLDGDEVGLKLVANSRN